MRRGPGPLGGRAPCHGRGRCRCPGARGDGGNKHRRLPTLNIPGKDTNLKHKLVPPKIIVDVCSVFFDVCHLYSDFFGDFFKEKRIFEGKTMVENEGECESTSHLKMSGHLIIWFKKQKGGEGVAPSPPQRNQLRNEKPCGPEAPCVPTSTPPKYKAPRLDIWVDISRTSGGLGGGALCFGRKNHDFL